MPVVVLGKHQSKRSSDGANPRRRAPAELCRVPPPNVNLAEREACDCTGQRKPRRYRSDGEVRDGAEKSVEQYRRIEREHGVIEIRPPIVVMRTQVQFEPKMLRNVIEER